MTRIVAENVYCISTSELREFGSLKVSSQRSYFSGTLTWSSNGVKRSSIDYGIKYKDGLPLQLNLDYKMVASQEEYKPEIRIINTACNFGGLRFWFLCPKCSKKCSKLYMYDLPYCRVCLNLTYSSSNEPKSYRLWGKLLGTYKDNELEEYFYKPYKKRFYRGKPTKKYQRYLEKSKNRLSEKDAHFYLRKILGD